MRMAVMVVVLSLAGCASPRAWIVERFPGGAVIGMINGRSSRFQDGASEANRELQRILEQRVFEVCGTKQFHELRTLQQASSRELRIGCGVRATDLSVPMVQPEEAAVRRPLRPGDSPAPTIPGSSCSAQQVEEMKRSGLSPSAVDRACSP